MVGEGVNLVVVGVGVVFEVVVLVNILGFFFLVKIDSFILVGVVLVGVLLLGVFYLFRKYFVENVIRNVLEERNENGVDFEVRNIGDGLILVEFYCYIDCSLL